MDNISELIEEHYNSADRQNLLTLKNAYLGKYPILDVIKEDDKPNNKLVNNFAKKLVDDFCGFFIGKAPTISSQNERVNEVLKVYNNLNNIEYLDYEIVKKMCIYGVAYELVYQDEEGITHSTDLDPLNTIIYYNNDIEPKPIKAITYSVDNEGNYRGYVYELDTISEFTGAIGEGIQSISELTHNQFSPYLSIIEYKLNSEKQGLFEGVLSLINSYNQAISEKANNNSYFSDSYMLITGADLAGDYDEDPQVKLQRAIKNVKTNKVFWFSGNDVDGVQPDVKFIEKPSNDEAEEHLLNRLEQNIFDLSSIAKITDDTFNNANSGVALQYKLLGMRNLARNVERNLIISLKQRYKLVFNLSTNIEPSLKNEWANIEFKFYDNLPVNPLEIAQAVSAFGAQVSDETALKMAGIDNVTEELERLKEESGDAYELLEETRVPKHKE